MAESLGFLQCSLARNPDVDNEIVVFDSLKQASGYVYSNDSNLLEQD